jgi:uncharacterized protein
MIIGIGRLKLDPGESEAFDFRFSPSADNPLLAADVGCDLLSSVHMTGSVTYGGNEFLLSGQLSVEVEIPCSRCLNPVRQDLSLDFKEEFSELEYPGEDAAMDLAEIASELWVTAVPMRVLCQEDCRGLCPICGRNLNEGECDCSKDEADPRLEALRGLISNDND